MIKDNLAPIREKYTTDYLTKLGIPHLADVAFSVITDSTGDEAIEMQLILSDGKHINLEEMENVVKILAKLRMEAMQMDEQERFLHTRYVSESHANASA